jgi:anion-transporting  ArsA/GET3 family ATPase
MDLATFLGSRVCIVSGKGGVGKTTVSAAISVAAAATGRRVLLVDVEAKSGLPALFDASPLDYEPSVLEPGVTARVITAERALLEFLDEHSLHWIAKRLQNMNLMEVVATAAPGLKDILVLGKVKQLERRGEHDLIVLDAPAAGHMLSFLGSAAGILDAVRVGPVRTQAREVQEMLVDPARTSVLLVTLPEETPVNETVETADGLVDLGIRVSAVAVNCWYPEGAAVSEADVLALADAAGAVVPTNEAAALAAASRFRAMRHALQKSQMARLEDLLALPFLRLPFLFSAEMGRRELDVLVGALVEQLRRVGVPT